MSNQSVTLLQGAQDTPATDPPTVASPGPTSNPDTKTSTPSITGLWRLLTAIGRYQTGPFTIALAAVTVACIQKIRSGHASPKIVSADIASVSSFYGPGTYYAWLINAVAAVCQSNPRPKLKKGEETETEVQIDEVSKDLNTAHRISIVLSTLGVVIYAGAAAIDELIRDFHGQQFSASRDAADRVCQVAWILSTFYLLHHFFNGCWGGNFRIPSLTTTIWLLLWTLITITMSADNIVRGSLKSTAVKVFVPFCISMPLPICAFALVAHIWGMQWPKRNKGWEIAVLNAATLTLSTTYVFTPSSWRYDANSPAAPFSGSNLLDLDQAVALAIGTLVAIPVLLLLWKRGRSWIKAWMTTLLDSK